MPALIRAELLALRTVGTTWALLVGAALLTAVLAVQPVLAAGRAGAPSIGTAGALLAVLGAPARGALVMLVLGVVTMTAEFRHATVTPVLLRSPRRRQVLVAKGAAVAVLGGASAVGSLAITLAVALAGGAVRPSLVNPDVIAHVAGLLVAYPVYGLAGVACGALIVSQPIAVLLPLAWLLYLESLALRLLPRAAGPWSFNGVTDALANAGDVPAVLPVAVGGAVLLAYAFGLLAFATLRLVHRDIT